MPASQPLTSTILASCQGPRPSCAKSAMHRPLMAVLSSDGFRPGKGLSHQATFRDPAPLKQGTGAAGFASLTPGTSGAHPPGARSTLPSCDNHKCPQGGRGGQTRSPGMVSVWILTSQIFVGFLNWEDHYRYHNPPHLQNSRHR